MQKRAQTLSLGQLKFNMYPRTLEIHCASKEKKKL
jgi:hypothetical protein